MVLIESVRLAGPIPLSELSRVTKSGLERLDPTDRERQLARWIATLKPSEHTDAVAATLELMGRKVPWDRKAPFDEQAKDATSVVGALTADEHREFDATYSL